MHRRTILFLIAVLFHQAPGQQWRNAAATPVPVRAGNTASYVSGDTAVMYIVSGRSLNDLMTTAVQRYDVKSNSWSKVAAHPTGLLGGATAVLKDSLYVIGGVIDPPGSGESTVWKYSIRENVWKTAQPLPLYHGDAKAVAYQDSLIYIAGGFNGSSPALVLVYNARTDRWRYATGIPSPSQLNFGGFSIAGDTLVYIGGTNAFFSASYYNDVYLGVIDQNDRAKIVWTKGAPFPGATRTFFDANQWQNGIIMTGGSTNNTFSTRSDEQYHFDAGRNVWTKLPNKPTAWLTGQSASVKLPNGEWQHICASGYGAAGYLTSTEIFSNAPVSVKKNDASFRSFATLDVYPNPFNPETTVRYTLERPASVQISIMDIMGRVVFQTVPERKDGGSYMLRWNGQDGSGRGLASGTYLVTLRDAAGTNGNGIATTKILLVR
ncbi:MAG: T9SS type A sorting domain-containing protein [Bacteroidetes bacterium]|nr:T9SS type A sorting domain-containing protein [Bacteroidota bacterium]